MQRSAGTGSTPKAVLVSITCRICQFASFNFISASAFLLGLDLGSSLFRYDFPCAWLAMAITI